MTDSRLYRIKSDTPVPETSLLLALYEDGWLVPVTIDPDVLLIEIERRIKTWDYELSEQDAAEIVAVLVGGDA